MIRAAGTLFITPDKRILLLKRAPSSTDFPGAWDFPGGTTEGDETAEQTARRETEEEIGFIPAYLTQGSPVKHLVTKMPGGPPSLVPAPEADNTVEFTTFVQHVEDTFEPRLNGEHDAFAWAAMDNPPSPLHPGVEVAIKKFGWNELDVARAIKDGILPSPQQYENMWLFALRITGTGAAYRRKHDEFVLRKPENYLTEDFLSRCNGLPVIVEHPAKAKLDSREYIDRNIGSIMLAYIAGDEVWGIARIYDAEAAEMMSQHQLSTSPSVVLRPGKNLRLGLNNGKTLLVEGDPKLLDHVAICTVGVWDKGEDPSGVMVEAIGDSAMADEKTESKKEEKKEDSARKDEHIDVATQKTGGESGGQQLDKMLSKLDDCMKRMDVVADNFGKRMDAVEGRMDSMSKSDKARADSAAKADAVKRADGHKFSKRRDDDDDAAYKARHDAEEKALCDAMEAGGEAKETVADKAKKRRADAEEEEEKERKADKSRKDAVADDDDVRKAIAELSKKIPGIEAALPRTLSDDDRNALSDAQARADNVFAQLGERAPHPLWNEGPTPYRRRVAKLLAKHSPKWKDHFEAVADSAAFSVAEEQIYADAMVAAHSGDAIPDGMLRAVTTELGNGAKMTSFRGHPSAWMNGFAPNRRFCTRINSKPQNLS